MNANCLESNHAGPCYDKAIVVDYKHPYFVSREYGVPTVRYFTTSMIEPIEIG